MKVITAHEALQISGDGKKRQITAEFETLMEKVEYEADEGNTSFVVDNMYKENIDKMKELGYTVEFVNDTMWGSYYSILWGEDKSVKKKKKGIPF